MSVLKDYIKKLGDKSVAFIGAGVAHRELIPLFVAHGADVTLCDKKQSIEGVDLTGVRLCLGDNYLDGLKSADLIFRTPGFMTTEQSIVDAIKRGATVTREIETFIELCEAKIYAVTGSDGKTTTTSLIADMLTRAGKTVHLGGNIGRAMLPIIDEVKKDDVVVCELSSFQLMSMHHRVDVAVVTNVTPNHLDHHTDMQEYIDAKLNILKYQNKNGVTVLGYDNETSRNFANYTVGETRFFSIKYNIDNGGYLNDERLTLNKNGELTEVLRVDITSKTCLRHVRRFLTMFRQKSWRRRQGNLQV